LAGVVAAEGMFVSTGEPPKFRFAVTLGSEDRVTCEKFLEFFGTGMVYESPRRRPHYQDEVSYIVRSLRTHLAVTLPFMDEQLPASFKREQYLEWKASLLDYWQHRAKRVRPCAVEGCEAPRRAHGLCRRHLYEQRGV
jgi:hypothetical protein